MAGYKDDCCFSGDAAGLAVGTPARLFGGSLMVNGATQSVVGLSHVIWRSAIAQVPIAPESLARRIEVCDQIKGSQGQRRVVWVKTEHPFTAISRMAEVHANQTRLKMQR
jgi:hypothetical protein